MRRIYLATPINGRRGDRQQNFADACDRIDTLSQVLKDDPDFEDCEFVSTFDVNDGTESEAEAMGNCIELVLTCDAIYLDHAWLNSRGCTLEYRAAKIYGLQIYEHDKL